MNKIYKHKSFTFAAALLGLASISTGCNKTTDSLSVAPSEKFDSTRAFKEVEALVQISPRDAGTPGARKAAEHIQQRMLSLGIETKINTFEEMTPKGSKTFHNVVGKIPGKNGRWIILGSHFDTMPGIENFQGANDSGSSTGILLELARTLAGSHPETGIIFAFFDGEEGIAGYIRGDGLHGSRHMAIELATSGEAKNVVAMILMDMVGDADLNINIPINGSASLKKQVFEAADALGVRKHFSLGNGLVTDDHTPFLDIGIPAIDLIDFRFGSAPRKNDYWHTDQDNLDHISTKSLEITGTVVLKTITNMIFK